VIVIQHNTQRNGIRVTVTDQGVLLESGWGTEDDFHIEQSVSLTEGDRRILFGAFSAGVPKVQDKWWDLSDGRRLLIHGLYCGDWEITKQGHGLLRHCLLQGALNFEEMTSALLRPIKEQIFMGAGEYSIHDMKELQHLVQRGCGLLSGVQQCGCGPDVDLAGMARGEKQLEDIVRQVARALTGREIEFK
jgi:hypothetical protein